MSSSSMAASPTGPNSTSQVHNQEDGLSALPPYPFLYTYDTQEQALAADRLRRKSKEGVAYPPLPNQPVETPVE
jgi:hypothetical protein